MGWFKFLLSLKNVFFYSIINNKGVRIQSIDFDKLEKVTKLGYTFVILEPKPLIATATTTTTTTTTTSGAGATTTTTTTSSSTAAPDCVNISF